MHRRCIHRIHNQYQHREEIIELESTESNRMYANDKSKGNEGHSETVEGPNLVEELQHQDSSASNSSYDQIEIVQASLTEGSCSLMGIFSNRQIRR